MKTTLALAALLLLAWIPATDAQFQSRTFNQLPASSALSPGDVLPIQQTPGTAAVQTSIGAIQGYIGANLTAGGDCSGTVGSITCASKLYHAANNTALAMFLPTTGRVRRDGFATPGDGGAADYTTTTVLCTLSAGAGDGASQVGLVGSGGNVCRLREYRLGVGQR